MPGLSGDWGHPGGLTFPSDHGRQAPPKMHVDVQKLSPVLLELAITVDAQRVSDELGKAYQRISKTARVSGFRKGKAPRKVLSHLYGPRVAADVAQKLVEETYQKAIDEQQVQTVSQPAIEAAPVPEKGDFSYKARVEILPQIESVSYEGFEVEKPSTEVSDERLSEELESLRVANSTLEPPKEARGAQKADFVTIDFEIEVGGEVVEGAGATDFEAELGSGNLLPAIEDALLGLSVGGEGQAEVDMPDAHPHPKLKGQKAVFKLKIKELKERILPALDDEFAKDLGDYETLDALKEEVRKDLAKRLEESADNVLAERLVAKLVEANPIDVPPALVQQQNQVTERDTLAQARARGQQVNRLPDELRARIHADSELKVRAGLLMAEIAKKEAIKIGDPELEEGLQELAEQTGKNVAKVRAEYRDPKKREMLVGMILENKVLDIIQSKSKITTAS